MLQETTHCRKGLKGLKDYGEIDRTQETADQKQKQMKTQPNSS